MKKITKKQNQKSQLSAVSHFIKCAFILMLLISTYSLNSQWTSMYSGTSQLLTSVNFHGRSYGYSVGLNNVVTRTTDGGSSWTASTVYSGYNYMAVYFTGDNTGYVTGSNGKIIKTNNGTIWGTQISSATSDLRAITFINANTGFIAGDNVMLKTTNAGTNWDYALVDHRGANYYYSIDFVNANTGYSCGYTDGIGLLVKSTDGGNSWSWQSLPSGLTELRGVKFKDANTGVAVGNNGKIIRTSNGGTNWVFANCSNTEMFYSVSCGANAPFYVTYNWYAVGASGKIFKSTDNGANFYQLTSGVTASLYEVECVSKDTVYICGSGGTILRSYNGGGSFVGIQNVNNEIPSEFSLSQNYPNPFNPVTKISFAVPQASNVKITVYDALGKVVRTLIDEYTAAGSYTLDLEANDLSGGIYFCRMEAGSFNYTRRMVLVK